MRTPADLNARVTRDPCYTDLVMANLTISIDEGLLRQARIRALEQGTSVNALLRDYLTAFAGAADAQASALTDLLALSAVSTARRGSSTWTREELQRATRRRRDGGVRVFLDTNVLVYLFDADAPAKQERARAVVDDLVRTRRLVLSSQVLSELYVTVTRKLHVPLPQEQALRVLDDLAAFPVVAVDTALVQRAASRSATGCISYWDALILEAAVDAGAATVYSEDLQPGTGYPGVTIEDPFATT